MKVILSTFSDTADDSSATLVFKTLRVGFPLATVDCYWNGGSESVKQKVFELCGQNDCNFIESRFRTNDEVGEYVFQTEEGLTVFLDSDIVFWDNVEKYKFNRALIAGRYIRKHKCPFTKLTTEARLHPSLLFVKNPSYITSRLPKGINRFVPINYIKPFVVNREGSQVFYDSFCNLYQYMGGSSFDEDMLNKYDHLFCSSFVDEVSSCKELKSVKFVHNSIYKDHTLLKGAWKHQEEYFNKYANFC